MEIFLNESLNIVRNIVEFFDKIENLTSSMHDLLHQ